MSNQTIRTLTDEEEAAITPIHIIELPSIVSWMCTACDAVTRVQSDRCHDCKALRGDGDVALDSVDDRIGRFHDINYVRMWPSGTTGRVITYETDSNGDEDEEGGGGNNDNNNNRG